MRSLRHRVPRGAEWERVSSTLEQNCIPKLSEFCNFLHRVQFLYTVTVCKVKKCAWIGLHYKMCTVQQYTCFIPTIIYWIWDNNNRTSQVFLYTLLQNPVFTLSKCIANLGRFYTWSDVSEWTNSWDYHLFSRGAFHQRL